ncbi:hypothetical protein ACRQ5B_07735 [Pseudarthrobacter sp. L19]|uniref:hypothetical protein n=1 Tax=Pseudarthrobacter sp. L19 TaxID=3423951 RepID=UPI003D79E54D
MNENLIQTAQECWGQLTRDGRLRPKDYDADLVDELRGRLGLTDTKDFHSELRDISAQDLVEGLLTALKPLAVMMTDLLSLYEAIGATRASEPNLRVEFNFDSDDRPFEFDVQAFRDWESICRRVLSKRSVRRWEQGPAWKLAKVIREGTALLAPIHVETPPRLGPKMEWPPYGQEAPRSGLEYLDSGIARAWRVREEFLTDAVSRWPNREDYGTASRDPGVIDEAHIMVSDYWDHSIGEELRELAIRASAAPTLGVSRRRVTGLIRTLIGALDDAIRELPTSERYVQEEIKDLIEVFSLLMWGKRHELYSAWVFTRIVDAIGIQRLSFVVKAGRFSFDFKGAELATFESAEGPFSVWTEMRTKYHSPVGHGRTNSIQPDFRIVRSPIDDPDSSILAVEVKQYLRSALRNPADALADYTGGSPKLTLS